MANQTAVTLRAGEEHVIALEGLMSAGFLWEIADAGDACVVQVQAEPGAAEGADRALGAAHEVRFSLRAVAPGTTTVRFALRRPWEPATPADEHAVAVVVEP